MKSNITRKDFLVNAGKSAVGLTAVAGFSSLATTAVTRANPKVAAWPWPYTTLDPDEIRIQAHYLYYNGKACCAGVFGALVEALAVATPDPWAGLPMEMMIYGGGGGAGWGVLCGTLNGAAALINLVTQSPDTNKIITELWGWYDETMLPSDTANQFATDGRYLVHNYDDALPQNISGSPLCHVSVTEWCNMANKKVGDTERKERCARIAGDIAAKTAELLNSFFAGTFTLTYVDPAIVTQCLGCHGSGDMYNVMTKMTCTDCHEEHAVNSVEHIGGLVTSFKLSQNYPNPFNPSTKMNFSIPKNEKVRLEIYDIRGVLVKTLIDSQSYNPGNYQVEWNGKNSSGKIVPSGVYFAKMSAGTFSQTRKMSLVK